MRRKLTLSSRVMVDVKYQIDNNSPVVLKQLQLCSLPMMVGCQATGTVSDEGGYFIVNGSEKVIIMQERLASNMAFLLENRCEFRALAGDKLRSTSTLNIVIKEKKKLTSIVVDIPFCDQNFEIYAIFRLLGIRDSEDMVNMMATEPEIDEICRQSLRASPLFGLDQTALLKAVMVKHKAVKKVEYLSSTLLNEVLPQAKSSMNKAILLGRLAAKALAGKFLQRPLDSRDDIVNKRLCSAGMLFSLQFRQAMRAYVKMLHAALAKGIESQRLISIVDVMNPKHISAFFTFALATGKWGMTKGASTQHGVAQLLCRTNNVATLSHLRRVNAPINRDGTLVEPRQLHASQWGIFCALETPEGKSCGLTKNLAITSIYRCGADSDLLRESVRRVALASGCLAISDDQVPPTPVPSIVIVDGCPVAYANEQTLTTLRRARTLMVLPPYVSIVMRDRDIEVNCDPGGMIRPMCSGLPCRDEDDWFDMLGSGAIVLVGKEEELQRTDLVEMSPQAIFGFAGNNTPFPDRSQAPRNVYSAILNKHALGPKPCGEKFDACSHELQSVQLPLVSTRLGDQPLGLNAVVAVMPFGYNQEDALVFNKSAIERGMFHSSCLHEVNVEQHRGGKEQVQIPPPFTVMKQLANYTKLGPNGIVPLRCRVTDGDVIVGRTILTDTGSVRDRSVVHRGEDAVVDAIHDVATADGTRLVRLRLLSHRIPEIGDKFAQPAGQKGCIGMTVSQEDLPFTAEGVVPDIIINPHAFPSRMTTGMLIDMLMGKTGALNGKFGNSTSFGGITVDQVGDVLGGLGFSPSGKEMMYCGKTGKAMKVSIFIGVCTYARLRHQVADKIHARSDGPLQILTRQPSEGRSQNGALRIGGMEVDALVSHAVSAVLIDRLCKSSDRFDAQICNGCGQFAHAHATDFIGVSGGMCRKCGEGQVKAVQLPYSFKLLLQELGALHIQSVIKLK